VTLHVGAAACGIVLAISSSVSSTKHVERNPATACRLLCLAELVQIRYLVQFLTESGIALCTVANACYNCAQLGFKTDLLDNSIGMYSQV
jgi:hypothetical protein